MRPKTTLLSIFFFLIAAVAYGQQEGFLKKYDTFYDLEVKQLFPTPDGATLFVTSWLERNRYGFIDISE
ncbi:MAG: hypothetical protein KDC24_12425, partial [Saprospiraceae bacterium]|nr:hypothetical protein [Saprospiraceae bacterium]